MSLASHKSTVWNNSEFCKPNWWGRHRMNKRNKILENILVQILIIQNAQNQSNLFIYLARPLEEGANVCHLVSQKQKLI